MRITQELEKLSATAKAEVATRIGEMISLKSAMHAVVERSAGAVACAACGGKCCTCGKYHVSGIDLVAYLVTGKEIFTPVFTGESCPFLDQDHCLMPPGHRPYNCITFACEFIECGFSGQDKENFYAMERELRLLYQKLQQYLPDRRMGRSVMGFLQHEDR
jgi:hypothetical protein